MFQVVITEAGLRHRLRPEVEATDAIYWVNRLTELGYEADVVRTDQPQADLADSEPEPLAIEG